MLAPVPIVHDDPTLLLGDLRLALSLRPELADPSKLRRLAEHLQADERAVQACLEALTVEGEALE